MKKVIDWLIAYWPVIAAVVPSLIVALKKMPVDSKGWKVWLDWVLQLLSVLQPKDAAGTLKLPFTVSRPKKPPLLPPSP